MALIEKLVGQGSSSTGRLTLRQAGRPPAGLRARRRQAPYRPGCRPKDGVRHRPQSAARTRRGLYGRADHDRGRRHPRPDAAGRPAPIAWEDKRQRPQGARNGQAPVEGAVPAQPGRSARGANVAHHYDIGNDLYRLFLDDDLQYSCAYFTDPANSLEQAQSDKKAHIAAKLDLKPGQHVLDIGCGWGGTALYLNRVAGVRRDSASPCPKSS